jgi:hypothetical protein
LSSGWRTHPSGSVKEEWLDLHQGGVMRSRSFILPRLRDHVRRHAWTPWGRVRVRPAALGNDARLIGMASLLESALSP